jgi:hydroxyacylglutathione hydrolase
MIKIFEKTITPFQQNARVLVDEKTNVAAMVDPGGDVPELLKLVEEVDLQQVWLTHSHVDHAGGVAELLRKKTATDGSKIKLYGHKEDAQFRSHVAEAAAYFGMTSQGFENCPEPDAMIGQGDFVTIGILNAEVRFVPGHAPGHVVFYFPDGEFSLQADWNGKIFQHSHKGPLLISGDTLFAGSIGRTDMPFCDSALLLRSMREQIAPLPDETLVLPGHGIWTTIGKERKENPFRGEIF